MNQHHLLFLNMKKRYKVNLNYDEYLELTKTTK